MSYPIKYRTRTTEYRRAGHTPEETSEISGVSVSAIGEREKQLKEKGDSANRPLNRKHKKIDPVRPEEYINQYPDACLSETAEVFECSAAAVGKALKRPGFTQKKDKTLP